MIEIVSATRLSEAEFWEKSALGVSLQRLAFDNRIHSWIAFENQKGLPEVFNSRIENNDTSEVLIFIHDDVWIDDFFIADRILDAIKVYDIFGIVGNKQSKYLQPSWAFLNIQGEWDKQENLSGTIAHSNSPFGKIGHFGPSGVSCDILDGVLIGVKKSSIQQAKVYFDPLFAFHFYDVDLCMAARQKGLSIGTWPLAITHQSTGGYDERWLQTYQIFCHKWNSDASSDCLTNDHQHNFSISNMKQTPAHSLLNHELISMIPSSVRRIVDVGCMHGKTAEFYKKNHPTVHYVGIDIDPDYAEIAKQHCDLAFTADIEKLSNAQWDALFPSDCWIFGDCLEHLRDPWAILRQIREKIDPDGCALVCMPNGQHWGIQTRLLSGQFFYEDSGLMDRTHLRFFTRTTMLDMFSRTGWNVAQGISKTLEHLSPNASVLNGLRQMALACGTDPDTAVADALPFQYMFKLVPASEFS